MLKTTHEPFAGLCWLGGTLAADWLAIRAGYGMPVHPAAVIAGYFIAPCFAAGKNSPDVDRLWAPGPPRRNYHWRFHRGITHRVWLASLLTALSLAFQGWVVSHTGPVPLSLLSVLQAPLAGWWSHLLGDMIYGRIKILGVPVGLGWETGGISERGGRWFRDPAARVFGVLTAAVGGLWIAWGATLA